MNKYIINSINDYLNDTDSKVEIITLTGDVYNIYHAICFNKGCLSVNAIDLSDNEFFIKIPYSHIIAIEYI